MTLSIKQLGGIIALLVVAAGGATLAPREAQAYVYAVALVGILAIVVAATGAAPVSMSGLVEAARRAAAGERPNVPTDASGDMLRVYETLSALSEQRRKDADELGA